MRVSRSFVSSLFLTIGVLMAGHGGFAQDSIRGPLLGFSPNEGGSVVWPILGVPGASSLGRRLDLGADIRSAVVAPQQDYVLAIRASDAQAVVVRLSSNVLELSPISGANLSPDGLIAISPTGSAAALYDQGTKGLRVLRGLPAAPEIAMEFDTSGIPGRRTAIAVTDDASLVLMSSTGEDGDSLWIFDSIAPRPLTYSHVSSLAFIANRHDAVVVDDRADEAFLLLGIDANATRIPLLTAVDGVEGLSGVVVSDDGRRAFIPGSRSKTLGIVDLEGGAPAVLPCDCRPTGIYRLVGGLSYRLSEPTDQAMTVLDLSSGQPRILIIPPQAPAAIEGDALR